MAYRLLPGGVFEADTPEEIVALAKIQTKGPFTKVSRAAALEHMAEPDESDPEPDHKPAWDLFCSLLQGDVRENQRVVLRLIKARGPRGIISTDELRQAMNVASNPVVGGFISGITKNVGKAGLPAGSVVERQPDGRYKPGPLLLRYEPPMG